MSFVDLDKIKMKTLHGGKDKDDLKHCFFYPATSPYYNFYNKVNGEDVLLASNVQNGFQFTFTLGGWTWTVPDPDNPSDPFRISGTGPSAIASGSWRNTDNSTPTIGNDGNGESGTFTAAAGQTIGPEEEAASAAKA